MTQHKHTHTRVSGVFKYLIVKFTCVCVIDADKCSVGYTL